MTWINRYTHKIVTPATLKHIVECKRLEGLEIVFTSGCYDLFHVGHLGYITRISELYPNHSIVVALNSDDSVLRFKGSLPLNPFKERSLHVASMSCVRWVTSFDEVAPKELVQLLNPEIIIHGCAHGQFPFSDTRYLAGWNGELVQIPDDFGPSTSERVRSITHKGIRTESISNWSMGKFSIQEFLDKVRNS